MMKKLYTFLLMAVLLSSTAQAQVVITEIMYNPPESGNDSLEYIEIANAGSADVDLSGYQFATGITYTFGAVTITPGQHIVVAKSASAMQSVFGITVYQWDTGQALSNNGETITLKDALGADVDIVTYGNMGTWPVEPNGTGPSLELCNFLADNSDPTFWLPSVTGTSVIINGLEVKGTPGAPNNVVCPPAADHFITAQNFSFTPADITIYVGESVEWDATSGVHNVNGSQATYPSNPESFYSGDPAAAPWSYIYTFNTPGVYHYRCDLHYTSGMVGTVTVIDYPVAPIEITEIMYNDPGGDTLEYLELYNYGTDAISLLGFHFTLGINHVFPDITFNPGQYLILARDSVYFQNQFGIPAYQWTGGTLNNNGETIMLVDNNNYLVDSLTYKNAAPWPVGTNGEGASLVLCDQSADNGDPANWGAATSPSSAVVNGVSIFANPGALADCSPPPFIIVQNDGTMTDLDTPVNLDILANDNLPNPIQSLVILNQPSGGTATLEADNTVTYTPNSGFCGTDIFNYVVCDANTCDTGIVQIMIMCPPVPLSIGVATTTDVNGVADSVGVLCELTGVVYGVNLRASNGGLLFSLIDDNNDGIAVFSGNNNLGYTVQEGDKITVTGVIQQFNGLIQVVAQSVTLISSANPLHTPTLITQLGEETESQLVKIQNLLTLVNPAQWGAGTPAGFTCQVTDGVNTYDMRIDNDVELFAQPVPTFPFHLTGLGGQFDNMNPFTEGYQILPRYAADLDLDLGAIDATLANEIKVFPNPVNDQLFIHTTVSMDVVRISNVLGQEVMHLDHPNAQQVLFTSNWKSGVYNITFISGDRIWTTQVVK